MSDIKPRPGSYEEYQQSRGIWFDDEDRRISEQQERAHKTPELGEIPDVDPALDLIRQWSAELGRVPTATEAAKRFKIGVLRASRLTLVLRDEIKKQR